jgi:hypothetical protein
MAAAQIFASQIADLIPGATVTAYDGKYGTRIVRDGIYLARINTRSEVSVLTGSNACMNSFDLPAWSADACACKIMDLHN